MAYNLARNSRVFFTTNVNTATGAVISDGSVPFSVTNCFEVQVLDGFSFSQGTNQTTIAINEAGSTPIRGQRAFNTALNPVEVSFSTYIRPRLASNQATAEERVLWNALMGTVAVDGLSGATSVTLGGTPSTATRASTTTGTVTITGTTMTYAGIVAGSIATIKGVVGTNASMWNQPVEFISLSASAIVVRYLTAPPAAAGLTSPAFTGARFDRAAWVENPTASGVTTSYSQVTTAQSNRNQLQAFGMIFLVDSTWYVIDNCAMDSATIDFGLDAIATVAWTAKGTRLREVTPSVTGVNLLAANPIFATSGAMQGTAVGKVTTANYITNKLSTVTLQSNIGGLSGTPYTVVLTGGSIAISNNINYVTPNNIGTVNLPIGYYTGARGISGTLNAYLRTGSGQAADLLNNMLNNISTAAETKFRLQLEVGGSNNGTRVELEMPGVSLGVPSVEIADVVSTAITFNAQGTDSTTSGNTYDIENTNDLSVRYYSL
jgi:hypothetical protein